MISDQDKEDAVTCAEQIAKYAFMTAFAMSFPRDPALLRHNLENLLRCTKEMELLQKENADG